MVAIASSLRVAASCAEPVYLMAVKALAEAQTLSRVCGLFAQFDVVPMLLSSQRQGEYLAIDIEFYAASTEAVDRLLAKVQAMVAVQRAGLVARCSAGRTDAASDGQSGGRAGHRR